MTDVNETEIIWDSITAAKIIVNAMLERVENNPEEIKQIVNELRVARAPLAAGLVKELAKALPVIARKLQE